MAYRPTLAESARPPNQQDRVSRPVRFDCIKGGLTMQLNSKPVSVSQYVLMARSTVSTVPAMTAAMRMMRAGIFRVTGGAI